MALRSKGCMRMAMLDSTQLRWRRSSFTDNGAGNCVEIALVADSAAIRDSKNRDGGTLMINPLAWEQFRVTGWRVGGQV